MILPLHLSHIRWFVRVMVEMMQKSFYSNFFKQDRDDLGTCLIQKRTPPGWLMECVVWPRTGGRKILQIPYGSFQRDWFAFCDMIKDFLASNDYGFKNHVLVSQKKKSFYHFQ